MSERLRGLVERLAAPLQTLRDEARAALVAEGAAAAPALVAALDHRERDIRAGAALCLGALGAAAERLAADKLARLASADPDPSLRPLALRALADLAHPGCAPAIRGALLAHAGAPDLFARALACTGLGRIGDDECRRALAAALADPEGWVREAAQRSLAALAAAQPARARASEAAAAPREATSTALVLRAAEPAAEGHDQLAAALACFDLETQRRAQAALLELGAAAIPRASSLLQHPEAGARRAAAEVLGSIAAPAALEPLLGLLADDSTADELRAVALHAVAKVLRAGAPGLELDEAQSGILRVHLESTDRFVRAAAGAALLSSPEPDRAELLERLFSDDDEWVQASASRAIAGAAREDERALAPLLLDALARTTEAEGQLELLEALRRIVARPLPEDHDLMVGPVSYFLQSEVIAVRWTAGELCAHVAQRADSALLRELCACIDAQPATSLPLARAVARLARRGDATPVATLRKLLLGRDAALARVAATALQALGGRAAIEALIEVANARAGQATAFAAQALAALDPKAEVAAARSADGRWRLLLRHLCACGHELRWVARDAREELRCPECDREYVLSAAGKLFDAERTPFGACLCPGCTRKQPLIRRADSETLICPASCEVHVRPFDHPRQLRRLADLPLGACACCAEPQPLHRVDDEVRCYRSRRLYRAGARGFEPAEGGAVVDDVAAINRALLLGTLGIAQSGLAADPDGDGDPDR